MNQEEYQKRLQRYLRPEAAAMVAELLAPEKNLQLYVARQRSSKYGDYSPEQPGRRYHRISVNHDLPTDQFLVTLLHEFAHYLVQLTYGHRVQAHGAEWRSSFRALLRQAMQRQAIPPELHRHVVSYYFERDAIARGVCPALQPPAPEGPKPRTVADLPRDSMFVLKNRLFRKGDKLRTYYLCTEWPSQRLYRVSGISPVEQVLSAEEWQRIEHLHQTNRS